MGVVRKAKGLAWPRTGRELKIVSLGLSFGKLHIKIQGYGVLGIIKGNSRFINP
jgi:hypothetical protein